MVQRLLSEDEFYHRALNVPVQRLRWAEAESQNIEVIVRRDDLIDTYLSGNKFYKLFYNLKTASEQGYSQLLSFGGAYSNHLYALAAAGSHYGFRTVGVIRGERPSQLSPTLKDAEAWGMQLHFISRAEYRDKQGEGVQAGLLQQFGDFFIIPEGGANQLGVMGTRVLGAAIREQLKGEHTSVCLACGTGNTLAGVAAGMQSDDIVTGFSVLKGDGALGAQIRQQNECLGAQGAGWRLVSGYHGGGYAKKLPLTLSDFYRVFEQETGLLLDPVYTLKLFWGVSQLLREGYWPRHSRLVMVHTGGLQGRRGFGLLCK